jgi:nucleolar protein 56
VQQWTINGQQALDKEEENALKQLSSLVKSVTSAQNIMESYVRNTMQRLAPNVSTLVGESIAARLVAAAGGLDRLAEIPSGTIQVLGAEKALFRHIKEGTPPPKHGIIFQHEAVNRSPRKLRGKIARSLASNIAIAARADVFTGRDIAQELKLNFEKRLQEIRS